MTTKIGMATSTIKRILQPTIFPLAGGATGTYNVGACMFCAMRGSASNTFTSGYKDQWGVVRYLSQNASFEVTASDASSVTIKNNYTANCNVMIIPFQ